VPTYQEWLAEVERCNAEFQREAKASAERNAEYDRKAKAMGFTDDELWGAF
jgi:hypothetical protein